MTDTMSHLTTRVPKRLIADLDGLARQRRMTTGDSVSRADLVREALENMTSGKSAQGDLLTDGDDFGALVLDMLERLADEAERRHLLDDSTGQDFGMAIWPAAEGDDRLARLRAFTSKLHAALRDV
ncbi:hypothetical protein [Modicisalibacter sp. 'Wilcox']|uniref:hypothetical protein n=1 Tax=Modicisalibacter sp. 'Wilcox' TaxID=2679914 RepID=UPI0013D4E08B|nr:hypothetical protein [Modicisalibacter sp. 'Wilcox']